MDIKIKTYQIETTDGLEWIAEYTDLQFCSGSGQTKEEAIKEAQKNREIYLAELLEGAQR